MRNAADWTRPGRPHLYGTTADFLRCFGLESLDDLPRLSGIELPEGEQASAAVPTMRSMCFPYDVVVAFARVYSTAAFCPVYLYGYYDGEFCIAVRFLFVKFRIPLNKSKSDKKSRKSKKTSKSEKKQKNRKIKTDGGGFLTQLNNFKDMLISGKNTYSESVSHKAL